MKALILNSGMGSRMGDETKSHPKCMTKIQKNETIISRQLKQLVKLGIKDVVITTGYFDSVLVDYCENLGLPLQYTFVKNERYDSTNYIYSIYCAKDELVGEDILMMHGDLVFDDECVEMCLDSEESCMVVDSTVPLPEKDFKAVVQDERIKAVGISFFDNSYAAQPLYKLKADTWQKWMESIISFCENGDIACYAENAFNAVSDICKIVPLDVKGLFCTEIDTVEDWKTVSNRFEEDVIECIR